MNEEMNQERKHLRNVLEQLQNKIQEMEQEIFVSDEKIQEFRKYMWENKSAMDKQELNSVRSNSEQEALLLLNQRNYFKKLLRAKDSPYFASITIRDEQKEMKKIYIGMTYFKNKQLDNLIYDWRAPISSVFYDFQSGDAFYDTPNGKISCTLHEKRQYKIEAGNLLQIIDSNIHIEDEVLQEVLASDSGSKMKHIVTTIQTEQNEVIRNTTDRYLVVQGIAGSGKTSVALHRIAFLLYKLPNLTSNQILIFSPNQIFTEYISDVLPTLGEENTLQTTFHEYLHQMIPEYRLVESYSLFLSRYYQGNRQDFTLIQYKQSDAIIEDLERFVETFTNQTSFQTGICENHIFEYSKEELNEMFHHKYNQAPFFERIFQMASKMSEKNYNGSQKKRATYHKLLIEALGIKKNYPSILKQFFGSSFFQEAMSETQAKEILTKQLIHYEDALLFVYLKGLMEGFPYDGVMKHIVIDEAQDYSLLQYKILKQIFPKASFTILGDVHQTINPYYHYNSLSQLRCFWNIRYIELSKTYRSSPEIIEYSNRILNLHHVSAIQHSKHIPVIERNNRYSISLDVMNLKKKHKSVAIITHDIESSHLLMEELKTFNPSILLDEKGNFSKELVIIPAYLAKGLEFDSVIVYQSPGHSYTNQEKNLFYVAVTRAQHELIIYSAMM